MCLTRADLGLDVPAAARGQPGQTQTDECQRRRLRNDQEVAGGDASARAHDLDAEGHVVGRPGSAGMRHRPAEGIACQDTSAGAWIVSVDENDPFYRAAAAD